MEHIVDLHVHSHYSRATSKSCDFAGLYRWGKIKGITVIGTGDFTHPDWFAEMQAQLVPAEPGLFTLRPELAAEIDTTLPAPIAAQPMRFVPSVEIATIYSKGGSVRKLHQLIVMPSLQAVSRLNTQLERIGNLQADGRPILGLDSKELLRMALQADPQALYIPAHIWTPWFGMFGSRSGFDSIAEAYEELAPEIRAIETGLSSDPAMNWRLSGLDDIAIISNSDAHSPQKLGREATVINSAISFDDIIGAITSNDQRLVGTIEFFPEEGKYHADGHRACNVKLSPSRTRELDGICPVCNKPLVVGVDYRVGELADREPGDIKQPKQVEYIIPLAEILAELRGVASPAGKAIVTEYNRLIGALGNEFDILRTLPIEQIRTVSRPVAVAVERLRQGNVYRDAGFDGIYGTIKVFRDHDERLQ